MHYFVSYNGADRNWAEWIGHIVEETGQSVTLQHWDFPPGSNFVLRMQQAAASADKTIIILSPDYLKSQFAAAEWAAAFQKDPEGLEKKLLPIMVRECQPPGLLASIIYADIHDLPEDQAISAVLGALNGLRAKPAERPSFPGGPGQASSRFPSKNEGHVDDLSRQPVPRLKVKATDLDRSAFLRQSFEAIKTVFERNARAAMVDQPRIHIDVELSAITDLRASLYVDRATVNSCRVWLGGMLGRNAITFAEGNHFSDNSFNEMLTVEDGHELHLKATMTASYRKVSVDVNNMSPQDAGHYLWERFVARLAESQF